MGWRFDYRRWDGSQDGLIDDTDAVLSTLGYGADDIARLRAAKVI